MTVIVVDYRFYTTLTSRLDVHIFIKDFPKSQLHKKTNFIAFYGREKKKELVTFMRFDV